MRMKHTVEFKSGDQQVYEFKTRAESDKACMNARHLNKTLNTIKCIWIEPVNFPWRKEKIDFEEEIRI